MPYLEGLTDRQAAVAVRCCLDWKSALSLDLTDPGVDFTLVYDIRHRGRAHEAGQRFLDPLLSTCNVWGAINARGTQYTDSTHVLAAIRTRHRLRCVLDARHAAPHQRGAAEPAWVWAHVPLDGCARDGPRSDETRLPNETSQRAVPMRGHRHERGPGS
jgi:transposase